MNHDSYLKLKQKQKQKNFFNSYKGLGKKLFNASIIGNMISIAFAYFFVYEIAYKTILEPNTYTPYIIGVSSVAILILFEALKRDIFDKFSIGLIENKYKISSNEMYILTLFSALIISGSFYLSLNGAKNYASRDREIATASKDDINTYRDSISTYYNNKIMFNDSVTNIKLTSYESKNNILFDDNRKYDTYIEDYSTKYSSMPSSTWQERQEKNRLRDEIKSFRNQKDKNIDLLDKNEIKIKDIVETNSIKNDKLSGALSTYILNYTKEKNSIVATKIDDNKGNSLIFLLFSTLIELIILFGIYFNHYYESRSVSEYEELVKTDPKYKKYNEWNALLDIILSNDDSIGEALPYKKEMVKLLSANKIDMSIKDFDDALKIFVHLGILKTKGNKKLVNANIETGRDVIMKYLKID